MFKKLLIANRGEIAVRVIRACREMGIIAAAVYSDADRAALHVRMAAEAYSIGASSALESYLNIDKIVTVAERCGAEALHPGYGFLSENADFAEACGKAGIKFIGPSPQSMRIMGSKTHARNEMEKNGVPCVPGNSQTIESFEKAAQIANTIGYPLMLKAAAGGGGKGMRLVREPQELRSSLEAAQSEAHRAFGDGGVYIEKAILHPRHIEIQILADEHGNTIHLGERECSIQRRHQKVLEESPSPFVDATLRKEMGKVAVQAASVVGYTNAGTIEFLVNKDKEFYFLEMNTRLQVEHPVTELVTGVDLVQMQIRIAAGEQLSIRQEDVHFRGHAMECRIYAEDPDNHYFPSPGKITLLQEPSGPGVRLDSGVYEGWTVPPDYDPLLAKLTAYAESREQVVSRLLRALDEMFVGGIQTNIALFRRILIDPDFLNGKIDTGFLDRLNPSGPAPASHQHNEIAALAAGLFSVLDKALSGDDIISAPTGPLVSESKWRRAARIESVQSQTNNNDLQG
ncbi:MAG: acetyl-CoA carboxylase biotin carboxylase subunit [Terriglobales bacterium]